MNYVRKHNHFANPLFARILGVKSFQVWLNLARMEKVEAQHVEIPLEVNQEILVTASSSEDEEEVMLRVKPINQKKVAQETPTEVLEVDNNQSKE